MKITNISQEAHKVAFTIEIDKLIWQQNFKKVLLNKAKNIKIEGFRPGKAPLNLVEKRINKGEVYQTAINQVIQKTLPVFEETPEFNNDKHELIERPSVDIKTVDDNELVLTFSYDIMPEVTLGDYTNLPLNWKDHKTITEEDVDSELKTWLLMSKKFTDITDRAIKKDDIAVIDFVGSIDGKEFLGGKGENYNLKIGAKQFIDNFEDQLIGANIGEEKLVKVKFPKDYHAKEYANKPAEFKVTIKGIKEEFQPKLDNEFVASLEIPNVKTVDELKKHLLVHLQKREDANFKNIIQKEFILKFIDLVKVEYIPENLLQDEKVRIQQILFNNLKKEKLDFNQYLKNNNMSQADYENLITVDANNAIKYAFGIEKIAEDNNIEFTDKDYDEYLADLAKLYNLKASDIRIRLQSQEELIKEDMLNNKVLDYIIEANLKNPKNFTKKEKEVKETKKEDKTTKSKTKEPAKTTAKAKK